MGRYLPPEMMTEVLNRLPVRSRARFRCVCKSWCTLIPQQSLKRVPTLLVCSRVGPPEDGRRLSSYDMQGNLLKQVDLCSSFYIAAPKVACLDFVCLVDKKVSLYNPTTAELIPLPKNNSPIAFMGFGYLPSTKEFKALNIFYRTYRIEYGSRDFADFGCQVLSVGTDCRWRMVDEPPFPLLGDTIFFKGAINLLPDSNKLDLDVYEIASFNLEKEFWGRIALPPIFNDHSEEEVALRELRGCLCIVIKDGDYKKHNISIWLLENMVWVKEYSFDLPPVLETKRFYYLSNFLGPVIIDDEGNLLLLFTKQLDGINRNLFRVTCNRGGVIEVQRFASGIITGTSLYTESFLSFEKPCS